MGQKATSVKIKVLRDSILLNPDWQKWLEKEERQTMKEWVDELPCPECPLKPENDDR